MRQPGLGKVEWLTEEKKTKVAEVKKTRKKKEDKSRDKK
jgi:hypothetical protein